MITLINENTTITRSILAHNLAELGVSLGDTLIVHSSMKAIGKVTPGPAAVIEALIEAVGPDGNIIMPAFTGPKPDLDLRNEPSRLGLLPNIFLQYPGVKRSNHATHSVAGIGPQSSAWLRGHNTATALGVNSPLHLACLEGAKVLHLGTDLTSCSLLHVAEAIVQVPYLSVAYPGYKIPFHYTGTDGVYRKFEVSEPPGDSVSFARIQHRPTLAPYITRGNVGLAKCLLIDAKALLDETVKALQEDISILLCDNPKCAVCPQAHALCQETP